MLPNINGEREKFYYNSGKGNAITSKKNAEKENKYFSIDLPLRAENRLRRLSLNWLDSRDRKKSHI